MKAKTHLLTAPIAPLEKKRDSPVKRELFKMKAKETNEPLTHQPKNWYIERKNLRITNRGGGGHNGKKHERAAVKYDKLQKIPR